ncbi:hypothetical protein DFP72DRAFT_1076557 [Ephemerocybe angulata]|uniref:F-box domain-containing protein n=1 Tax=Ephemerocybe angulata TaxID=980116 RepID=A0A8H6LYW1_9AGAR|nr:hypothetical protein DFP72DRAFT_1076557 [Tulosesus angulatus]
MDLDKSIYALFNHNHHPPCLLPISRRRQRLCPTTPLRRLPADLRLRSSLEDQHQGQQQDLESRRGSLLPDLPPEILAAIFLLIPRAQGDTSWISVTHVCRLWREVALNCSHFWAELVYVRPRFMEFALARSGCAPISVHTFDDTPDDTLFKVLSPDRLQKVTLNLRKEDSTVLSHFAKTFPILETVVLYGYRHWLMPNNFLSDCPHLKNLRIVFGDALTWESLTQAVQRGTLRTLSVRDISSDVPATAEAFLECMRRMPLLQSLELWSVLPLSPQLPDISSTLRPVDFQHLQKLHLGDRGISVISWAWHNFLICPNLTHLRVSRFVTMPLLQEMSLSPNGFITISGSTANSLWEPVPLQNLTRLKLQDSLPALAEYFGMVQPSALQARAQSREPGLARPLQAKPSRALLDLAVGPGPGLGSRPGPDQKAGA